MEIMVVVVIIGMLAALVGPHIWWGQKAAERRLALAACQHYHSAVKSWCILTSSQVPYSLHELEQPLHPGEGNYTRFETDPWGGEFRIVRETPHRFRIWSNGPDGLQDTEDDICYEPLDE